MTIDEFGRTIKQRYPEYQQYSDSDIGQQMLNKYPQYKSQVTVPEPVAAPKTFFQKLSNFGQGAQDLAVGAAKGAVSTVKNAADLGENIFRPLTDRIGNAIVQPKTNQPRTLSTNIIPQAAYTPRNATESFGKGIEQTAELFTPMGLESKGAKLATKIGAGAIEFGSKAAVQSGGNPTQTAIGAGAGAVAPVISAGFNVAKNFTGRLLKGLGSGLSGVSPETIDRIITNPEVAQKASQKLAQSGNNRVLEENAKTILEGVSKIRKESSQAYGKGLEDLAKSEIDSGAYKASIKNFLDKYGSQYSSGKRAITNVEFDDPKMLAKASELINKINKSALDLNGKSLRNLANEIENSAFKTTGNDAQRLSFNAFVNELKDVVKSAVNLSTGDKLSGINQAYSQDRQLAEAVENIFGKVDFKNLSEVVKASQKLETMFAQKGLAPEVVDNFLSRIGVSPEGFKTTEAVRQISNKTSGANAKGLSIGEVTQQITSSIVTPQMVRDLSIATGMAKEKLIPFLRALAPTARNIVIQALLKGNEVSQNRDQLPPIR